MGSEMCIRDSIRDEFLGFVYPINEYWVIGLTMDYLYATGLIERTLITSDTREGTGNKFDAYTGVATFAVSSKISDNLSLGTNIKVIQESIYNEKAMGYGADIGALYRLENFRFGLSVQNFGTKITLYKESFPLPFNIKTGVSYMLFDKRLTIAADMNKPADNDINGRFGAEYWIAEMFALRAGYKTNVEKNTGSGISAGLGFKYKDSQIDYSYLPFGDLGDTHRLSLTLKFGALIGTYKHKAGGYHYRY